MRTFSLDLRELWKHRQRLYFLTRRDAKVRYTQTIFGVAQVLAPHLLMPVLFTAVFGILVRGPSNGAPCPQGGRGKSELACLDAITSTDESHSFPRSAAFAATNRVVSET